MIWLKSCFKELFPHSLDLERVSSPKRLRIPETSVEPKAVSGLPPVLITRSDLAKASLVAAESFECDCACPDNGFSLQDSSVETGAPLQCSQVYLDILPGDHHLIFNPLGDQGVAVLDQTAFNI